MKKFGLLVALFAIFAYFAPPAESKAGMEKCFVTGRDGTSAIKPGSADTDPDVVDEDPTPWIWVPMGECNKVNRGDFSGAAASAESKIDVEKLN